MLHSSPDTVFFFLAFSFSVTVAAGVFSPPFFLRQLIYLLLQVEIFHPEPVEAPLPLCGWRIWQRVGASSRTSGAGSLLQQILVDRMQFFGRVTAPDAPLLRIKIIGSVS